MVLLAPATSDYACEECNDGNDEQDHSDPQQEIQRLHESACEQQDDGDHYDHNQQNIHSRFLLSVLLSRVAATFALGDLVPAQRVIADAGRRHALPLPGYEKDSEDNDEHTGTHHDL